MEVFGPFHYDAEVAAGTAVVVLLVAEFVLCSGWGDESVARIFMTEGLRTGV